MKTLDILLYVGLLVAAVEVARFSFNYYTKRHYDIVVQCDLGGRITFNTQVPAVEFVEITENGVIFKRAVYRTSPNEACVYARVDRNLQTQGEESQ